MEKSALTQMELKRQPPLNQGIKYDCHKRPEIVYRDIPMAIVPINEEPQLDWRHGKSHYCKEVDGK